MSRPWWALSPGTSEPVAETRHGPRTRSDRELAGLHLVHDAAAVEALDGPPPGSDSYYAWAWIDEAAGILRSRYFVPSLGIGEDEATGAAAVVMGGALGRPLEIRQGVGSVLHVRPGPDGTVEVGGVVDDVETRELAV